VEAARSVAVCFPPVLGGHSQAVVDAFVEALSALGKSR
jgi:hypothetical protein